MQLLSTSPFIHCPFESTRSFGRGYFRKNGVAPEYGPLEVPLDLLCADRGGIPVLSLQPGRDTQRSKLGLSGSSHKFVNITGVLSRSRGLLVLQILNLAQPLVMQQF